MFRVLRRGLARLSIALGAVAVALSVAPAARAEGLRVVTFNMAMGLAFRKPLLGLIEDTFGEHELLRGFDVLGLQEACENDRRPIELFRSLMVQRHGRVFEHLVLANSKSKESCRKAEVILSSYPIVDAGGLALPKVGAKRSAAWVDIAVGSETVRVYNVHLSNRAGRDFAPVGGRLTQANIVLDHWQRTKRRDPRRRGIVLGDFNAMGDLYRPGRHELAIEKCSRVMTPSLVGYIPTMWLPYQTDWIFSSGLRVQRSYVIPTVYSDHYVVMADYVF